MAWYNSAPDLYDSLGIKKSVDTVFGEGGLLGDMSYNSKDDTAAVEEDRDAAISAIRDLTPAQYSEMDMQGPEAAADVQFRPASQQMGQAYSQGPTEMGNIQQDPAYKAEQMAQLAALKELRDNGGMNMQDKANLAAIQGEAGAQARGQRDALMQQYQARGMGGGGREMLGQMMGNQNSQNQANLADLNIAAQAQNRAMNAGNSAANLAGNMQSQDWNQQSSKAQAADAINQFNAKNLTSNSQWNAGQGNNMNQFNSQGDLSAQSTNQAKNQGVNNATATAGNQNQLYNNYLMPQQTYQNASGRAGMLSNAYSGRGQDIQGDINRQSASQAGQYKGLMDMLGMGKNDDEEGGSKTKDAAKMAAMAMGIPIP